MLADNAALSFKKGKTEVRERKAEVRKAGKGKDGYWVLGVGCVPWLKLRISFILSVF